MSKTITKQYRVIDTYSRDTWGPFASKAKAWAALTNARARSGYPPAQDLVIQEREVGAWGAWRTLGKR